MQTKTQLSRAQDVRLRRIPLRTQQIPLTAHKYTVYHARICTAKPRRITLSEPPRGVPPKPPEASFRYVLELWLAHNRVRCKGTTQARYRYLIDRHILPQLGDLPVNKVSATQLNLFLEQKLDSGRLDGQGGLSPAYVSSILLVITSALKFAVNERLCPPLKNTVYKPLQPRKERAVLTVQQQRQLEQYALRCADPTATGVLLSLYTGLRIGEICALSWEDIDLNGGVLHVRHTVIRGETSGQKATVSVSTPKTAASYRDVPIPSKLLPILRERKHTATSPYVASKSETFVNPRTYEYRYHRLLEGCGLPSINYHALRHTFATRCIEAGVDVKSLSEILGHANVSVTLSTYVHSSMALKRAQLEKLSAFDELREN